MDNAESSAMKYTGPDGRLFRHFYAGRAEGFDDLWITRMTHTLPQDQP